METDTRPADPWHQVLNGCGLDWQRHGRLKSFKIQRIYASRDESPWDIYFHCPFPAEPDEQAMVQEIWAHTFGPQIQGRFYFVKIRHREDLEPICFGEREGILSRLAEELPSAGAWLTEACWHVTPNRVNIGVKNAMGFDYLRAHQANCLLEGIFNLHYGLDVAVDFSLETEGEDLRETLARLDKKALESIEKPLEKPHPDNPAASENPVILGRKITGSAIPLEAVTEEERSVIVKARVFAVETPYRTKNGTWIIAFSVTDHTGAILCKRFINETKHPHFDMGQIVKRQWYLIRGPVRFDPFSKELTLFPNDIMRTKGPDRLDQAGEKRAELHLHTKMSFMDATDTAEVLVRQAVQWGHPAVAITDHGVVQAFPEAMAAAGDRIKVIYGVEGYLFDPEDTGDKGKPFHIVILAKNRIGLEHLYRIISASHLDYYKRTPRIPRTLLSQYREGLILGSACESGELFQKMLRGDDLEDIEETARFYDYLEIQPRDNNMFMVRKGLLPDEAAVLDLNRRIYNLGKRLGIPVAATGDVHFLNPEDEIYRRILMAGKGMDDSDNQASLFFRTTDEMLAEFAYLGESEAYEVVVANTRLIADWTERIQPVPNTFAAPVIEGSEKEIRDMALEKAAALYGDPLPAVIRDRLDKELGSIIGHGYAVLYLIAHKLVKKSNEDGYLVGSRGSVGSSLVAYLCHITEVNPMPPHYRCPGCRYSAFHAHQGFGCGVDMPEKSCPVCGGALLKDGFDIPFEVFLGFEGEKIPDIDLNFSGEYQNKAHKYIEELLGKDSVFRAGTIATIADKTAYGFVKNYFDERKIPVRTAEINRLVQGCMGVKRTTGQHPGGIIVLPKDHSIYAYTPIQHPADDVKSGVITTHFDYHAIDNCLVKLDILGHDDPTVIKMLEDMTGVDAQTVPLDDPRVLSLFQGPEALGLTRKDSGLDTGTLGVPEFGTRFVRQMLEDTKPASFEDLVRISGFSHGTDVWLGNAQTLLKSGTATMKEVIGSRDDIMIYLIRKGVAPRQSFKIMENVRKGRGVSDEDVRTMRDCQVPDWYIESCRKIQYMFPKAHAVAYVMMAFRIAWFKVYYPLAFYASQFSSRAAEVDADLVLEGLDRMEAGMRDLEKRHGDHENTAKDEKLFASLELAREMFLRGFSFKPVDLQKSAAQRFIMAPEEGALRLPLTALQGVGLVAAQNIVRAREERPFFSVEDLKQRGRVSKTVIDALKQHGALAGMQENNQQVLFAPDATI
jgi:DNA polymerase-3 subunit alpha (Gram-positive type)